MSLERVRVSNPRISLGKLLAKVMLDNAILNNIAILVAKCIRHIASGLRLQSDDDEFHTRRSHQAAIKKGPLQAVVLPICNTFWPCPLCQTGR